MIKGNSKAAIKATSFTNQALSLSAGAKARKINIIASYDPLKTEVVPNVPKRVFSHEDVGSQFGWGFMAHRLAKWSFLGSTGVETWITPQEEASGAVAASGSVDFSGSTGVKAGIIYFYTAADLVDLDVAAGLTPAQLATNLTAAINKEKTLSVIAVVDGVTDTKVNITAKSKGSWGNDISLAANLRAGESLPEGVSLAFTPMLAGSGVPDVQEALDEMGTGDLSNSEDFTDMICGYGNHSPTLDALSAYNGNANALTGNYKKEVGRPFRHLIGDTTPELAGLTALIALSDARAETDMTNGILSEPGSYHHPVELAAVAMGVMAKINTTRAEEGYIDQPLPNVIPSPMAGRWTNVYDQRDTAVKSGISTTMVKNNVVYLQNMLTFWRPEDLPLDSNAYRSMRNISLVQSMWSTSKAYWGLEKWKGITVVDDVGKVTNSVSQEKARSADDVLDGLLFLTREFTKNAWLYTDTYTIEQLKLGDKIVTRGDGSGWDYTLPVVLSGEGGIINGTVILDAGLAVLNN